MITENQYQKLLKEQSKGCSIEKSAMRSGMSEKTARKYLKAGKSPGELKKDHNWQTREDPFEIDWEEILKMLEINHGLEAKTVFEYLNRECGRAYQDGQLRTLQRRFKTWRAVEGPDKEVIFDQIHIPGSLGASDFTDMNELGISINGELFQHKIFHFVLTYSNWETGSICFSESFESLSSGLQNAIWRLGCVPNKHRTDRLTAAVNNFNSEGTFQKKYKELLDHYGIKGEMTNPGSPNENGDSEQSHHRFKRAADQSLMLRGNRDFVSREEYEEFLYKLFEQLNKGRLTKFHEETAVMRGLPEVRMDTCSVYQVTVRRNSTITVKHKIYTVPSRLIGEKVRVKVYQEHLEVYCGGKHIERIKRVSGKQHGINYRHIIKSLVRKPGAFEGYRYRDYMFPCTYFKMAYEQLSKHGKKGLSGYLKILELAAMNGEDEVRSILISLHTSGVELSFENVLEELAKEQKVTLPGSMEIDSPVLAEYDRIFSGGKA